MAERRLRYRTGSAGLDQRIVELLDEIGVTADRDLLFEIFVTAMRLARDDADTLDLKITNAALKEMRNAFRTFAPYRGQPKVTIFGSARTRPEDPLYAQARNVARVLAAEGGWSSPERARGSWPRGWRAPGREHSFGVSIRLPFEQAANPIIADDDKLVSMKYFFTRKLMLIKESKAFVCLPGRLRHARRDVRAAHPDPDRQGRARADRVPRHPGRHVLGARPKSSSRPSWWAGRWCRPSDLDLFLVTDDVHEARDEICGFYANYDSMRFVGDELVIRLRQAPTPSQLAALNHRFGDLAGPGGITAHRAAPRGGGRRRPASTWPGSSCGFDKHRHGDAARPDRRPERRWKQAMNRPVAPPGVAPPAAAYSLAVLTRRSDRACSTPSGIVPTRPDGSVPEALADQVEVVWASLLAILAEAGMAVTDVVSITTYVVAGGDLGVVMAGRDRAMAGHRPASTLVVVPALARPEWQRGDRPGGGDARRQQRRS